MTLQSRLNQLEKKAGAPDAVKPVLIVKHMDGVYRDDDGREYTADDVAALQEHYTVILICYVDWRDDRQRPPWRPWGEIGE